MVKHIGSISLIHFREVNQGRSSLAEMDSKLGLGKSQSPVPGLGRAQGSMHVIDDKAKKPSVKLVWHVRVFGSVTPWVC